MALFQKRWDENYDVDEDNDHEESWKMYKVLKSLEKEVLKFTDNESVETRDNIEAVNSPLNVNLETLTRNLN